MAKAQSLCLPQEMEDASLKIVVHLMVMSTVYTQLPSQVSTVMVQFRAMVSAAQGSWQLPTVGVPLEEIQVQL